MDKYDRYLKLAAGAAAAAAQALERKGQGLKNTRSELPRDIKIEADYFLEKEIVRRLQAGSNWPILSEEMGLKPAANSRGHRWIVDPLDGSLNFSRDLPMYCISIALWKNDQPILGVIYDFLKKELFTGLIGRGAWLNGRKIKVGKTENKSQAILCTGFPAASDFSKSSLAKLIGQIRKHKKVRLFGSAALSLAYVACGRADVYQEENIKLWDVAAGIALVQAAGGKVRFRTIGEDRYNFSVQAGNSSILRGEK